MNFNGIKQIGIVGGGASALMLCIEAAKVGIRTTLLDPKIDCVGAQVASEHIVASINNTNIEKLSLRVDAIVFNTKLDFELECRLHTKIYPTKGVMNEISNYKNVLEILEMLEIPTPKVYYQDNREMAFEQIEHLALPFRFIKQYGGRSEIVEVRTHEDVADFILEVDEKADSFIIQPMPEYTRYITCLCLVEENGKLTTYEPLEEVYEDNKVCTIKVADSLSKAMVQKLTRFNRKIVKELQAEGCFTIKYGIKANRSVEFIEITPEIALSGLLTIDTHDVSIYEQYMHMILGMNLVAPTLEHSAYGTIKEVEKANNKAVPYHLYNLGLTNLCITKGKKENE